MDALIYVVIAAIIAYFVGRGSQEPHIRKSHTETAAARSETAAVKNEAYYVQQQHQALGTLFDETLRGLRQDSALLPSLVRWSDAIEESRDLAIAGGLKWKRRPALKSSEEVQLARTEGRLAKRELKFALNRLDLYESLAPWLAEYTELSVSELIDALREEEEAKASEERGEDPISRYVPKTEWAKLTPSQRNQLALDRYCDPKRRRTPWAAGIQYERFIGYTYEKAGYTVEYRGAVCGREDMGIDLVCENATQIHMVQCKRLSVVKELPVRENTIAQIFGSAEFDRMMSGTSKPVAPVLITTYQLSDAARRFARHLKVQCKEMFELKSYPMIKCNVNPSNGERIYHLPMDQQYDNVIVGNVAGEFYASTVKEAESAGFRRAFRWRGVAN